MVLNWGAARTHWSSAMPVPPLLLQDEISPARLSSPLLFRRQVGAELRSSCSRKGHLPSLHCAGRSALSAAALLSPALTRLLNTEAHGVLLPSGSGIYLQAAPALMWKYPACLCAGTELERVAAETVRRPTRRNAGHVPAHCIYFSVQLQHASSSPTCPMYLFQETPCRVRLGRARSRGPATGASQQGSMQTHLAKAAVAVG